MPGRRDRRRARRCTSVAVTVITVLVACGACGDLLPAPIVSLIQLRAVEVAAGLSGPLYLTAPAGDSRLFVVEQPGRIRIIKNGTLLGRPFLDITPKVSSGGERGLLSVAFHPAYASTGLLYVDYTDLNGDTRVERYTISPGDPDLADPASAQLVLAVAQPFANHNGGLLLFGPDGMLYIGMGDGGGGGDPFGNGQSRATLLGKLLRIDVDHGVADAAYAVPADNPFVGQTGARPEIWATGLRNPWRFAFDRVAGLLYVADVGQSRREEIDVVPANRAGVNYGWNVLEGSECYGSSTCNSQGLERPVVEYSHDEGCSVTGGAVYRGSRIPAIKGRYFYSDYCEGFVRSFRYVEGRAEERRTWEVGSIGSVLSFGQDAAGELYILSADGRVYRLEAD